MTDFHERYAAGLAAYVSEPGEELLSVGYELGRTAVREGLGLLDLAGAHHRAMAPLCADDRSEAAILAAGVFFEEALAAYEVVHRVLGQAREEAASERQHAAVIRRLTHFLADASIALDGASSVAEILQLVAEHALEIVPAECCLARAELDGGALRLDADAQADGCAVITREVADELATLHGTVAAPGEPLRLTAAELQAHPALAALRDGAERPARSWLAAPLRTLDGRDIGLLQVFSDKPRGFGELDEASLVQLAQMSSAAIERAQLYRRAQ